jgi:hypothetical protein
MWVGTPSLTELFVRIIPYESNKAYVILRNPTQFYAILLQILRNPSNSSNPTHPTLSYAIRLQILRNPSNPTNSPNPSHPTYSTHPTIPQSAH